MGLCHAVTRLSGLDWGTAEACYGVVPSPSDDAAEEAPVAAWAPDLFPPRLGPCSMGCGLDVA
eukprot:7132277-Alexandrium_andersonii.AAC.1